MNKFAVSIATLALGLAFGTGASAQGISKDEYNQ